MYKCGMWASDCTDSCEGRQSFRAGNDLTSPVGDEPTPATAPTALSILGHHKRPQRAAEQQQTGRGEKICWFRRQELWKEHSQTQNTAKSLTETFKAICESQYQDVSGTTLWHITARNDCIAQQEVDQADYLLKKKEWKTVDCNNRTTLHVVYVYYVDL